jgi:hypothetical protein
MKMCARQAHDFATDGMGLATDAAFAIDGIDEIFRIYRDNRQGAAATGKQMDIP